MNDLLIVPTLYTKQKTDQETWITQKITRIFLNFQIFSVEAFYWQKWFLRFILKTDKKKWYHTFLRVYLAVQTVFIFAFLSFNSNGTRPFKLLMTMIILITSFDSLCKTLNHKQKVKCSVRAEKTLGFFSLLCLPVQLGIEQRLARLMRNYHYFRRRWLRRFLPQAMVFYAQYSAFQASRSRLGRQH